MSRAILSLVVGAAFLTPHGSLAFEGRYVAGSKDYRQELTITKRADGRFDVTAVVGTDGCSGLVSDGLGAAHGDTLKVEVKEDNFTCTLVLRRTKKGVSVEDDQCLDFHGPSCEFAGDYHKRR